MKKKSRRLPKIPKFEPISANETTLNIFRKVDVYSIDKTVPIAILSEEAIQVATKKKCSRKSRKTRLIITEAVDSHNNDRSINPFTSDVPEFDYIDGSANPCDDFYQYTCGRFEDVYPLPKGEQTRSHFTILQDEIHELMRRKYT